jgi:ribose 5-phosphate isomerase A
MNLKQLAANRALDLVKSGMTLGLGSGSTSAIFVDMLGEALKSGRLQNIQAVPTSKGTAQQAEALGIPLTDLSHAPRLDMAIDGADEVDPALNLIKGLGKAALREKIVETHTDYLVIIVDDSKIVPRLGTKGPLPVEIVQFEAESHLAWLKTLCSRAELWCDDAGLPFQTDNGNYLVRCWFENGIADVYTLNRMLNDFPGVVQHGLFLDMARRVIVAGTEGIRILESIQ